MLKLFVSKNLLKPINDSVRNIAPAQLIRYVAIYMLISGIINLCGSVALITAGALGGAATAIGGVAGTNTETQQAVAALGAVSGLANSSVTWARMSSRSSRAADARNAQSARFTATSRTRIAASTSGTTTPANAVSHSISAPPKVSVSYGG